MMPDADLSIVAIVRNEAAYIAEWIAFHRLVGVQHFYIYDDESADETVATLDSVNAGDITVIPWGFGRVGYVCDDQCHCRATPQVTAHNHFLECFSTRTKWAAFIDVDEFLHCLGSDSLVESLKPYKECAALFVNWLVFGSNGHENKPNCLTIEAYTRRGLVGQPKKNNWGKHGKLIAKPSEVAQWGVFGSHNARFCDEKQSVDELFRPVFGSTNPNPTAEKWRLAHFYHRSKAEAAEKVARNDRNAATVFQPDAARLAVHDLNDIEDTYLLRYVPRVKEELAKCILPNT